MAGLLSETSSGQSYLLPKDCSLAGDLPLEIVHDGHGRCVISSRLTNTVDVAKMIFFTYWIMVDSFDQCFVISHPGGNSNWGWRRVVLPW